MEHLEGASLRYALALLTKIKLDWKAWKGRNTLAYYEHLQITVVKKFITLEPDEGQSRSAFRPEGRRGGTCPPGDLACPPEDPNPSGSPPVECTLISE